MSDQYITHAEMLAIAKVCKSLDEAWKSIIADAASGSISINFLTDDEGYGVPMKVWDSNGECIGRIGVGEGGDCDIVFYLGEE